MPCSLCSTSMYVIGVSIGVVSGTQTSFFFFVGAGKNEGLGHRLH